MVHRKVVSKFRSPKFVIFLTLCNATVMMMNVFCVFKDDSSQIQTKQEIVREIIRMVPCDEPVKRDVKSVEDKDFPEKVPKVRVKYLDGNSENGKELPSAVDSSELPLCSNITDNLTECELSFADFRYPSEVNMSSLLNEFKTKGIVREKVINEYRHTTILRPDMPCARTDKKGHSKTILLYLIKSSPRNFDRRNVIRQTWANENNFREIRRIFVLGEPLLSSLNNALLSESNEHRDILQFNFLDAYYNLTLKAIGCINWASKYCSSDVHFVTMVDDDYYVATDFLLDHLKLFIKFKVNQVYMGGLINNPKPQREISGKWHIPVSEYPFNLYPPVIRGGTLVMSVDFLLDMHIAIPYTKPLPFDDVYMAIIAYKLGVRPLSEKRFIFKKVRPRDEAFRTVLSSHGYKRSYELKQAWRCHLILQKLGANVTRTECLS